MNMYFVLFMFSFYRKKNINDEYFNQNWIKEKRIQQKNERAE
jgi:hypothetical protein